MSEELRPYRPAVAVMLLNREGKVFVGQRIDNVLDAWQMPQGGVDPGEDCLEAAYRELEEETGILREHVEIVARAKAELLYELPDDLKGKVWGGKYRGQSQTWFLARFIGTDDDVNIATADPEFRAWKWADPSDLPAMIVPFKKRLYESVLEEFAEHLAAA